MADNLDLITAPVSAKLATDVASHSGVSSHAQVATLYEVTGAEGSKTVTPVVYATQFGATSEAAAATDTSTSGLNGLLKRIAQRLTALIALLPSAFGANGGLKVDIVGDTGTGSTLDTDDGSVAAAQTNIALTMNLRYRWNGSAWVRGGWTPHAAISAASTNGTNLKASAGTIGYITVGNYNAAKCFLKIYNKASAPTVGTDVPVATFIVPGAATGGGTNVPLPDGGMTLSTGISYAITTGAAVTDTGAVALSEVQVNIGWL
jgi:hypothetical protein